MVKTDEVRSNDARAGTRELRFTVPGEPVPKQMGVIFRGRVTKGGRVKAYEDTVRLYARLEITRARWVTTADDRYAVELVVFVADHRRTDCDNLSKSILDGLKWAAFPDDSQVTDLLVRKRVDPSRPRVEVTITRLASSTQRNPGEKP